MSCAGSTKPPAFGPLAGGVYHTCPAGEVLVGVDVAYDEPAAHEGFLNLLGLTTAAPLGCENDADCRVPGQVCSTKKRCVTPMVLRQPPGAVRGVTAFYCATADAVAGGSPAAPFRRPLADADTGAAASTATFTCPAGQALTGATAWVNPQGDAVEQIQLNCSSFALGAAPGATSVKYPAALATGSAAAATPLSTRGGASTAIFANGLAQAYKADALVALGFGCQDYAAEFDTSDARQLACCAGTTKDPQLCRGKTPQSAACDAYMVQYCAEDCAGGTCRSSTCGCLGSPVGLPGCYDSRCADTPAAYRTAQVAQQEGASCPSTASCDLWQMLGRGQYLTAKVPPPTGCAPASPSDPPRSQLIIIVVLFVLLVFLAVTHGRKPARPMFLPPPPPGILPDEF
jgi:hypothetical protein